MPSNELCKKKHVRGVFSFRWNIHVRWPRTCNGSRLGIPKAPQGTIEEDLSIITRRCPRHPPSSSTIIMLYQLKLYFIHSRIMCYSWSGSIFSLLLFLIFTIITFWYACYRRVIFYLIFIIVIFSLILIRALRIFLFYKGLKLSCFAYIFPKSWIVIGCLLGMLCSFKNDRYTLTV